MAIKGPLASCSIKVTTLLFDLDGTLVDLRPTGLRIRFMIRAFLRFFGAIPSWQIPRAFFQAMHNLQNNASEKTNYEEFIDTLVSYANTSPAEIERRTRLLQPHAGDGDPGLARIRHGRETGANRSGEGKNVDKVARQVRAHGNKR